MSVPDNYQIIQTTSTDAQIRVDIDWDYDSITDLYIWQQDTDTGVITYYNLGDFAVVEKSDGSGDYIEVENVSTSTALVNTARRSALTQTYDLANSEALDPVALVDALDKAIKIIQEQDAITGTPDNQSITSVNPFTIPDKVTRANGFLGFDENGDPIIDASDSALLAWAKEWAVNPEDVLISEDAGGNQTTDFSSLHYSKKSEDFSIRSDEWANQDEDVVVDSGKYSAFHWSEKSSGFSDKSNLWANELEDVVVDAGEYSAFHWAKKAEAFSMIIDPSAYVPIAGNSGNPMTGDLHLDGGVSLIGDTDLTLTSGTGDINLNSANSRIGLSAGNYIDAVGNLDLRSASGSVKITPFNGNINCTNNNLKNVADPLTLLDGVNLQTLGGLKVHAWILYNNTTGVHNVIKSFNITSSQRLSLGKTEIVYPDTGNINFLVSSNVVSPDTGIPIQLNELRGQRTSTSAVFVTNDTGSFPVPADEGRTTVIIYKDV